MFSLKDFSSKQRSSATLKSLCTLTTHSNCLAAQNCSSCSKAHYIQLTCVYQQQFYRLIIHYACNSPLPYMVIPVTTPTNPCSPPKIFPLFSIHYLKLHLLSSCYLCACVTCSSCAYPSSSSLTRFGQF